MTSSTNSSLQSLIKQKAIKHKKAKAIKHKKQFEPVIGHIAQVIKHTTQSKQALILTMSQAIIKLQVVKQSLIITLLLIEVSGLFVSEQLNIQLFLGLFLKECTLCIDLRILEEYTQSSIQQRNSQ